MWGDEPCNDRSSLLHAAHTSAEKSATVPEFKAYRRRWLMMIIVQILQLSNGMVRVEDRNH